MPESVQSCFELSIHFPVFFFPRAIFRAVHGWFANRQMYGKFKTRLDAFWHSYIRPIFFLKSFSYCQKFPIHDFFRSDVLWKLFDIAFPYKHCYFEPVCLLVKMASKTVIRPIDLILLLLKLKMIFTAAFSWSVLCDALVNFLGSKKPFREFQKQTAAVKIFVKFHYKSFLKSFL